MQLFSTTELRPSSIMRNLWERKKKEGRERIAEKKKRRLTLSVLLDPRGLLLYGKLVIIGYKKVVVGVAEREEALRARESLSCLDLGLFAKIGKCGGGGEGEGFGNFHVAEEVSS